MAVIRVSFQKSFQHRLGLADKEKKQTISESQPDQAGRVDKKHETPQNRRKVMLRFHGQGHAQVGTALNPVGPPSPLSFVNGEKQFK